MVLEGLILSGSLIVSSHALQKLLPSTALIGALNRLDNAVGSSSCATDWNIEGIHRDPCPTRTAREDTVAAPLYACGSILFYVHARVATGTSSQSAIEGDQAHHCRLSTQDRLGVQRLRLKRTFLSATSGLFAVQRPAIKKGAIARPLQVSPPVITWLQVR